MAGTRPLYVLRDPDDSVPQIFRKVNGYYLDWPVDDDGHFGAEDKELLASICRESTVFLSNPSPGCWRKSEKMWLALA